MCLSLKNGCQCCLPNWQASHISLISFSFKVGSPLTTHFDCIALSLLRLMWAIRLCYNSMSVSSLVPFATMANFISCKSRMNIQPSLRPRAMSRPSFSMKQPPWSNRTCISLFNNLADRDQRYMQDILNVYLVAPFPEWDIPDMMNRMSGVVSGLDIAGSIRLS